MRFMSCVSKCLRISLPLGRIALNKFTRLTTCSFGSYAAQPWGLVRDALRCVMLPSAGLLAVDGGRTEEDTADIEDNITHLIILAKLALEKGERERAEAILGMGLKICDDRNIIYGLPFIYDILATMALSNGEIEKAEKLLVTAIEKLTTFGAPEDNHHVINFKLRLSRIYSAYRDYDMAEIGFKNCLQAQELKITNGDVSTKTGMLYVNILFWYGIHKIRNENFPSAKKLLDTAYQFSRNIKGLSPYQEMVILYTLADMNIELTEYDVALTHMQNAVMLGKGIGSPDLPRCYVKLAKIYLKMHVYDQAMNSVMEGMKLAKLYSNDDLVEDAQKVIDEIERSKY